MIKKANNFLTFNGNCNEALEFYNLTFGADIVEKVTYGEAEMVVKGTDTDMIMNSNFELGGVTFSCFDDLTHKMKSGNQVSFWLEFSSDADLDKVYRKFDCVLTKKESTFWNSIYAKVEDPFGVIWELNYQN